MLKFLQRLFNHQSPRTRPDGLTQPQREALLDLLVFAEFQDNFIAEAEVHFVHSEAEAHPWESTLPLDQFYDASVTRTRSAAISPDARNDYLAGIIARLDSQPARHRAYELCRRLIKLAGEPDDAKTQFLQELWKKLDFHAPASDSPA